MRARRVVLATVIGCALLFGASLVFIPVEGFDFGPERTPVLGRPFGAYRWAGHRWEAGSTEVLAFDPTGKPTAWGPTTVMVEPLHWPLLLAEWVAIALLGAGVIAWRIASDRRRLPGGADAGAGPPA